MTPIFFSQLFAIAQALAPTSGDAAGGADAGAPDLVVSPAVIEWPLPTRGRSQVRVRVGNAGTRVLRLRAAPGSWRLDGDGVATPLPADPDGLAGRLQVHPAQLELAPGQQRSLRLWLATPDGLDAGEHRALLRLALVGADGAVGDRFDLAVYAWRGPVQAQPRLDATAWRLCDGELRWRLLAGNDGNRHARLDGWLLLDDGAGATGHHALPRTPVLPGATQRLALAVPWPGPAPVRVALQGRFGALDLATIPVPPDREPCPP